MIDYETEMTEGYATIGRFVALYGAIDALLSEAEPWFARIQMRNEWKKERNGAPGPFVDIPQYSEDRWSEKRAQVRKAFAIMLGDPSHQDLSTYDRLAKIIADHQHLRHRLCHGKTSLLPSWGDQPGKISVRLPSDSMKMSASIQKGVEKRSAGIEARIAAHPDHAAVILAKAQAPENSVVSAVRKQFNPEMTCAELKAALTAVTDAFVELEQLLDPIRLSHLTR